MVKKIESDKGVLEAKKKAIIFCIQYAICIFAILGHQKWFFDEENNLDKVYFIENIGRLYGYVFLCVIHLRYARFLFNYKNKKIYFMIPPIACTIIGIIIFCASLYYEFTRVFIFCYNILACNCVGAFFLELSNVILEENFYTRGTLLIIFITSIRYIIDYLVEILKNRENENKFEKFEFSINYIPTHLYKMEKIVGYILIVICIVSGILFIEDICSGQKIKYIKETDFINYAQNHKNYYRFDDEWIIGKKYREIEDRYAKITNGLDYYYDYYEIYYEKDNNHNFVKDNDNHLKVEKMEYEIFGHRRKKTIYTIFFDEDGKAYEIEKSVRDD